MKILHWRVRICKYFLWSSARAIFSRELSANYRRALSMEGHRLLTTVFSSEYTSHLLPETSLLLDLNSRSSTLRNRKEKKKSKSFSTTRLSRKCLIMEASSCWILHIATYLLFYFHHYKNTKLPVPRFFVEQSSCNQLILPPPPSAID